MPVKPGLDCESVRLLENTPVGKLADYLIRAIRAVGVKSLLPDVKGLSDNRKPFM